MSKNALILVDIQNDFCPGGALEVPAGDEVVAVANRLQPRFDLVVATQDWHPPDHGSFASNQPGKEPGQVIDLNGLPQVLWPDHCVQDTPGAELHPALDRARIARIFQKGVDPRIDSYSGFYDNGHRRSTGMAEWLKEQGAEAVYVLGLATDYCVKFTALDAIDAGFRTYVVEDGCRGIDLHLGDVEAALEELRKSGAIIIDSGHIG